MSIECFQESVYLSIYGFWEARKNRRRIDCNLEIKEVGMENNKLTSWELLILVDVYHLARKTPNSIISRVDIQREIQPVTAKLLKEALGYKIGKTPENTVDRVIQDLEKKGFLEMQFRRGGRRGTYKVNVMKASKVLEKRRISESGAFQSDEEATSDVIAVASPPPAF
jgi:DNA-binding MarR family transcriptional regulator